MSSPSTACLYRLDGTAGTISSFLPSPSRSAVVKIASGNTLAIFACMSWVWSHLPSFFWNKRMEPSKPTIATTSLPKTAGFDKIEGRMLGQTNNQRRSIVSILMNIPLFPAPTKLPSGSCVGGTCAAKSEGVGWSCTCALNSPPDFLKVIG